MINSNIFEPSISIADFVQMPFGLLSQPTAFDFNSNLFKCMLAHGQHTDVHVDLNMNHFFIFTLLIMSRLTLDASMTVDIHQWDQ